MYVGMEVEIALGLGVEVNDAVDGVGLMVRVATGVADRVELGEGLREKVVESVAVWPTVAAEGHCDKQACEHRIRPQNHGVIQNIFHVQPTDIAAG